MSANTWYAISLVGYFAALICLIVTVVLYVRLDILDVIGDLTGRTVARELKSMRENRNKRSGSAGIKVKKNSTGNRSAKNFGAARSRTVKTAGKTAGRTSNMTAVQPGRFPSGKAKNGTAEMGSGYQTEQPDKRVLHSKTDKLNNETERLYEQFDPRVEYSRTDILTETGEPEKQRETALLKPGTEILTELLPESEPAEKRKATEVLKPGTVLLEDTSGRGTTLLMEEEQVAPVKFSVTRSYLVVHSEEKIL